MIYPSEYLEYWKSKEAARFWIDEWKKGRYRRELDVIKEMLETIEWQSLFEIGCGVGKNIEFIREKFPEKEYGGSDINKDFLSEASRRGIKVIESRTESLELERSYDVFLSVVHLQHLPQDVFQEAVDNLKRFGGYILLMEGYEPDAEEGDVMKSGLGGRWNYDYERHFTVIRKEMLGERYGHKTLVMLAKI